MDNKNKQSRAYQLKVGYWLLVSAASVLMPIVASATVVGDWNITALSRTDVTAIKAPGLIPEHTVDTFTDTYNFSNSGFSTYGINNAEWVQKRSQYTVILNQDDVFDLEQKFRDSLQQNEPDIIIRQLKLVSRKLTGYELDNGLWGSERYEYKIDSCLDYCEVVRVVQTLQIVGQEPTAAAAATAKVAGFSVQSAEAKPGRSGAVDAAVDAVLKHMRNQRGAAQ